MSTTPRTDDAYTRSTGAGIYELYQEAKEMELELIAARKRIADLEYAGDRLAKSTIRNGSSHEQWLKTRHQ